MTKPTYDSPDILYVHEGLVRFDKFSEPEMALIMRSERKVIAWISQMNRELGEANVKQQTLPGGRTGWAVPLTLEEDARLIARGHFEEVIPERPSIVCDRDEPQAVKTPRKEAEVIHAVCAEIFEVSCANTPRVCLAYKAETSSGEIHLEVSKQEAARCARHIGETVEVLIRKRE